ncbi:DUF2815 family protein [Listeria ilorinensis]|uniref:DUF2815 family protein n=1 Tax=Listeria ilorinensis TaxID=2867439 RepID=UPI001EF69920|nr:DUF2815 family protein [Listeria ilorinensis]
MASKPSNTKVILKNVRLSYVHLLEPDAFEGQEPKYSTMLIIPKTDKKAIADIKAAQQAALEAGLSSKFGGKKPAKLKTTLRDADEELDTDENPEFAGCYFMNVSSKTKPGILDKQKQATESPDDVYSGVYANVSLNFYAYNTAGNRGISAGLNNVMVLGRGDYLGGRASAESDFEEFEAEIDDDEDMFE